MIRGVVRTSPRPWRLPWPNRKPDTRVTMRQCGKVRQTIVSTRVTWQRESEGRSTAVPRGTKRRIRCRYPGASGLPSSQSGRFRWSSSAASRCCRSAGRSPWRGRRRLAGFCSEWQACRLEQKSRSGAVRLTDYVTPHPQSPAASSTPTTGRISDGRDCSPTRPL